MEVTAGYKQTEVGVIPEDWKVKKLTKIADVRDGTHESPKYVKDGVKFVTSKNIVAGHVDFTDINLISYKDAVNVDKRSKVDKGDILMSMIGTVGNSVLIDFEPDFCIKNVALIKPRGIEPQFLIQLLFSNYYQLYIDSKLEGGIQKFVSLDVLRNLAVPIPIAGEQTAIAAVLSDADSLITSLEKLIAKKRDIKQDAMQQLLTGEKRLPGFTGTWEITNLGEVAEFVHGRGLSKADLSEDGPQKCIHYGQLFTTYKELIREVKSGTNKDDGFLYSQDNDVLMPTSDVTPRGLATASCMKENGVALGGGILIIRFHAGYDGLFFSYFVAQNRTSILKLVKGSTVFHLYAADLAKLEVCFPEYQEQIAVSKVLSDMDAEIEELEHKLAKYKMIKQGMMQELLTGRKRLI